MQHRSQIEILVSTIGYSLVVLCCTVAGYCAQQVGSLPDWLTLFSLSISMLPLLPYFFLREVALEQPINPGSSVRRNDNVQSALIYFVLTAIVTGMAHKIVRQSIDTSTLLMCLLAYAPFVYLAVRTLQAAQTPEGLNKEYRFAYRVLFPGLATCMIPFAFGWAYRETDFVVLAISIVVVVAASELCRLRDLSLLRFLGFVFAGLIVSSMFIGRYPPASTVLFGFLFAFAMGTSEAAKRVHLVASGMRPLARNEDKAFYLAGANWANSIFPLLLFLLPLLVTDFPTVPIALYVATVVITWQVVLRDKEGKVAYVVSVLFGYALPILIVTSLRMWPGRVFMTKDYLTSLFAVISVIAIVLGLVARFLDQADLRAIFLNKFWRNESYVGRKYPFWLFLIGTYVIALGVYVMVTLLGAVDDVADSVYKKKGSEILFCMILIVLLRLVLAWWQGSIGHGKEFSDAPIEPPSRTDDKAGADGTVREASVPQLWLQVLRPGVSLSAGVLVTCGVLAASGRSFVEAVALGLPMLLVTMFGFLLNDLVDLKKDQLSGADKPIARGYLPRTLAIRVALFLVASVLIVEWIVGFGNSHDVIVATLIGVTAYSLLSNWAPWAKGVVTAFLALTPLAYLCAIIGTTASVSVVVGMFVFVLGREILMDASEMSGDLRASFRTVAFYLGSQQSRRLAWTAMFGAVVLLFVATHGISSVAIICAGAVLVASMFISRTDEWKAIMVTRGAILLGSIGVALSL